MNKYDPDCFTSEGAPLLCPKCRSGIGFDELVLDTVADGVPAEIDFKCKFCGAYVAQFSYGRYYPAGYYL